MKTFKEYVTKAKKYPKAIVRSYRSGWSGTTGDIWIEYYSTVTKPSPMYKLSYVLKHGTWVRPQYTHTTHLDNILYPGIKKVKTFNSLKEFEEWFVIENI